MSEGFQQVDRKLETGTALFSVFNNGLQMFRQQALADASLTSSSHAVGRILNRARADHLRFPHRKILDALLARFDYTSHSFQEANFSALVKEAHIGKNAAKEYLEFLEQKGYILRRSDGYRLFFKIRQ